MALHKEQCVALILLRTLLQVTAPTRMLGYRDQATAALICKTVSGFMLNSSKMRLTYCPIRSEHKK